VAGNERGREGEGRLPGEIVSLIHHVELHRSGWWDRALERLVLATVWRESPTTVEGVVALLNASLDGRLAADRVQAVIESSIASGSLVETLDGGIKACEELDKSFRAELESVAGAIDVLRDRLLDAAEAVEIPADRDELWTDFEELFMVPLVRDAGARIYEVVTSGTVLDLDAPTNSQLVAPLCEKYGPEVRLALVAFLDPKNPEVRSYVLRSLNADFVREAAGLGGDVLKALTVSRGHPDRVRVFVDTNFVFSFLGLHDNPSNEVARDLVKLVERVESSIKVELYVLPITVDETRRVLRRVMEKLSGVVARTNLAAAAGRLNSTGLAASYLAAAASFQGRGTLTAEAFFGPYEANLVAVLRDHGIELYNTDLDALRLDEHVIDDLHDQDEVQKQYAKRGSKGYDANLHDMVLWHFTDRQRPASSESALEVGNWVCTVDYGLIAFDRSKRKRTHKPPICLSPSSLVQLLQFWAPRSDELDTALVGAIREPLLFLDFDSSTEQATIRILQALSRFDGVGDLSTKTIYNVLTDDALRSRLGRSGSGGGEGDIQLVETAVVSETKKLEQELDRIKGEKAAEIDRVKRERDLASDEAQRVVSAKVADAAALKEIIDARDAEVLTLSGEVTDLKTKLDDEKRTSQEEINELRGSQGELADRLAKVEEERAAERGRKVDLRIAVSLSVVAAAGVGALSAWAAFALSGDLPGPDWISSAAIAFVGLLGVLLLVDLIFSYRSTLAHCQFHRGLRQVRKACVVMLVGVGGSLIASFIWQEATTSSPPG
jgi:hypothetical protein